MGATINAFTPSGGEMQPKWKLKPWAQRQVVAWLDVRCDLPLVDVAHRLVGERHHNDVARRRGVPDGQHLEPHRLGLRLAAGALSQPNDHVDPTVSQVEGVGVTLAPVAQYRDRAPFEPRQIGVLVVEDLHASSSSRRLRRSLAPRTRTGWRTSDRSPSRRAVRRSVGGVVRAATRRGEPESARSDPSLRACAS